jgi:hypothetical protein
MSGQDFLTELKSDMKIDELKIISLNHFCCPAESMKKSLYHRIVSVRTGKVLSEEKTVCEEGIQNNGKDSVRFYIYLDLWVCVGQITKNYRKLLKYKCNRIAFDYSIYVVFGSFW